VKITQTFDDGLTRQITILKKDTVDLHISNSWYERDFTKDDWQDSASSSFSIPLNEIEQFFNSTKYVRKV
jgi:hypothetical protein